MINPTNADIGRHVVYRPKTPHNMHGQQGEITSFNEKFVFVRYGLGMTSAATRREDLEWVTPWGWR